MANIAYGLLEISPIGETVVPVLRSIVEPKKMTFSYGVDVDFEYADQTLIVSFTGRWTCDDAWDALDAMMEPGENGLVASALIAASIKGEGREPAVGYRAKVVKDAGAKKLRRFLRKQ